METNDKNVLLQLVTKLCDFIEEAESPFIYNTEEAESPFLSNTIERLNPAYCCGCTACWNSCPVNAIEMTFDDEGFLKPIVNHATCIQCKKCKNACPVLNTQYKNNPNPPCYAVMGNDALRKQSSSGGMFTMVAEHILAQGGYVCGAVLTERFTVEFLLSNRLEDLERMRGSKYVQSNLKDTYRKINVLLEEGTTVLFAAEPCQVAGLYGFLGKAYANLYTLDLVCHGAPSQGVFDKYLEDTYGKENLLDFKFRTKELGYNSFNQIAYLRDGSKVVGNIKFDPYEKTMHSGLTIKKVCADCPFAVAPRQGDISIGDFWGISKHNPEYNDGLGTSNAVINNAKGQKLFDAIRPKMKLCEEVPFDFARRHNRFGRRMKTPEGRKWYYTMAKGQPFAKAVDYALNLKFDVGIIGLWYGRNYGSMATYYALHQVLTNRFHLSVLMIENPLRRETAIVHPYQVANDWYKVSKKRPLSELHELNAICDSFIVGSDQLWNVGLSRPYQQYYYLSFVNDEKKRIAYGTSFGPGFRGTEEERVINSHYLRRFDHVSVRDTMSYDICTQKFGVEDVVQVCDPVFLCDKAEYYKLIERANCQEDEPYLLCYMLDPSPSFGKMLEKLSVEKQKKIIVLLNESPGIREENVKKLQLRDAESLSALPEKERPRVEVKPGVHLYDWLWYYAHAEAVVTDSFHGTIFSIVFEKPFITLKNTKRGVDRFISLLSPLGLMDRLFSSIPEFSASAYLLDGMDYTEINRKLNQIIDDSMTWLEQALFSKKQDKTSAIYDTNLHSVLKNKG